MNNRVRWRVSALASAIALLGSFTSMDAQALALGRITVQSALGEPLRAEIDIAEITADEANSLKAGVASAEAFRAAGLEYTSAVVGVQVSLQKRADGRSYLRLSSTRPVNEPFVDLVLDASWSSGRVMRDYTLLFDPPSQRNSAVATAPVAPVAPMLPRPPLSRASAGATPAAPPTPTSAVPLARPLPGPVVKAPAAAPAASKAPSGGQQVTVKQGDTAGKIAAQNKSGNVSLDQMLVALLLNNPDAFIKGNVNRLKSGAVLDLPGQDQAEAIPQNEASRTIVAQSRNFNDFRRKLAENVPAAEVDSANRQAGGKVEAKVEDRAPASATPDKLTLSKGALQGKAISVQEKIAKDRQARDASDRVAELSKNIGDLNRIAGPTAQPAAAGSGIAVANTGVTAPKVTTAMPVPAAPAPAASATKTIAPAGVAVPASVAVPVQVPATAPVATPVPAISSVANLTATSAVIAGTDTAAVPAATPALAASAPALPASQVSPAAAVTGLASAPVPVVSKKPAPPPAPAEPSLLEELTDSPFILPGFGALALLLAGFGFFRYKKRHHNSPQVDSSFLESRLQPDSFFGASGGQHIDTNEGGATGSSLVYSPSQLDAAGDVDPVAEADVYLAYGRDLQAEEILKEAIRTSPTRVAIHSKLMEIYAKRRDIKAFEVVAVEAFSMTRGEGPEWAYIAEMGRNLDPANPMYQPGGQPLAALAEISRENSHVHNSTGFGSGTLAQPFEAQAPELKAPVDFDLDLDFSVADEPAVASPPPSAPAVSMAEPSKRQPEQAAAHKVAPPDAMFDGLEMDFSTPAEASKPVVAALSAPSFDLDAEQVALADNSLSFTSESPVAKAASTPAPKPATAAAAATLDNGMLEFDLASLSLDLPGPAAESRASATAAAPAALEDPLETKFALAEEFRALGDMDGARSLAEEVAAEASGSLKSKSQAFLNALA